MKRVIQWFFWNVGALALFYFGWMADPSVEGARNVLLFLVWFTFAISLALLSEKAQEATKKRGPSVPLWLMGTFDVLMAFLLVWHGLWWTAIAHALTSMLQIGVHMQSTEQDGPKAA